MDISYLITITYFILMCYIHLDNCVLFNKISKEGIGKFPLQEVSVESILHCALACSMKSQCFSFSFLKMSQTCFFHVYFDVTSANMILSSSLSVIYARNRTHAVCESEWKPLGDLCFFFGDNVPKGTWNAAKMYCNGAGGYLAELDTQEKQTFVSLFGARNYWTGGRYNSNDERWYWNSSGKILPLRDEPGFSSWAPRKPDSSGGKQCMAIRPSVSFDWGDLYCSNSNINILCEAQITRI